MSFGEELKRERELREISLREVSESTKISLRHLEALERNDFAALPGGVFNRGFVRAYSQYIGVDPDTMVDAYLQQENSTPGERNKHRRVEPASRSRGLLWVWCVLGILVVGAAAYFSWSYFKTSTDPAAPASVPAGTDDAEAGT